MKGSIGLNQLNGVDQKEIQSELCLQNKIGKINGKVAILITVKDKAHSPAKHYRENCQYSRPTNIINYQVSQPQSKSTC